MATSNCLVILQNIKFFVLVKKETRTASKQLEGEKMMTELSFGNLQ